MVYLDHQRGHILVIIISMISVKYPSIFLFSSSLCSLHRKNMVFISRNHALCIYYQLKFNEENSAKALEKFQVLSDEHEVCYLTDHAVMKKGVHQLKWVLINNLRNNDIFTRIVAAVVFCNRTSLSCFHLEATPLFHKFLLRM